MPSSLQFKVKITIHGNIVQPLKNIHILKVPKPGHNNKLPSIVSQRTFKDIDDYILILDGKEK